MLPDEPDKKCPKLQIIRSATDFELVSKLQAEDETGDAMSRWQNSEALDQEEELGHEYEIKREKTENHKIEKAADVIKKMQMPGYLRQKSEGCVKKPPLPVKPSQLTKVQSLPKIGSTSPDVKHRMERWRNTNSLACAEDGEKNDGAWLMGDSGA